VAHPLWQTTDGSRKWYFLDSKVSAISEVHEKAWKNRGFLKGSSGKAFTDQETLCFGGFDQDRRSRR
jgi:hypothetical protein